MSLLEQQNFLARIFTDESLRISFWENPETIGKENGLVDLEIDQLKRIIADDLNFFANSLINKRLQEVERLLPLTRRALQNEFAPHFRAFANDFQPTTIKKHLEDALEFCKYIQLQQFENRGATDTAKFEQTKYEFFSGQKAIAICFLLHDVFSLKKKFGVSVWLRIGNRNHNFIL